MAKALDAPYEAGGRGGAWLKVKQAHTLDLVILAAEWGHGRRKGWLSNLHLGAREPRNGRFVMLGKTFKGLTDAMLAWQTQRLLELEVSRDAYTVYVRPEQVVEIAVNEIQASPHYPAGMALRFARVKLARQEGRGGRYHRHRACIVRERDGQGESRIDRILGLTDGERMPRGSIVPDPIRAVSLVRNVRVAGGEPRSDSRSFILRIL